MFDEDYVQMIVEGADLSATVDALLHEAEMPVPNPGNPAKIIAPGRPQVRNPSMLRKGLTYAAGGALIAQQALAKNSRSRIALRAAKAGTEDFGNSPKRPSGLGAIQHSVLNAGSALMQGTRSKYAIS